MARAIGLVGLVLLGTFASADVKRVHYSMHFDLDSGTSSIEMKLPKGKTAKKFWMSAWIPGDYQRWDFGGTITEISFYKDGEEVKLSGRDGVNGFIGAERWDSVKYRVKQSRGNFSDNLLVSPTQIFVNPAGVLGFADGMLPDPVEIEVDGPDGWDFHGAIEDQVKEGAHVMDAKNHETLGDSPFVFAPKIEKVKFVVGEKPHYFVAVGNTAGVDAQAFADVAKKAVEQGLAQFGDLPYDRYTFFGIFGGFPAGLEHGTSCRLGFWGKNPNQMAGLIFHEYFHAFNVKHIRPEALRPIDPLHEPKIESLWWLEGVTDYFADLFMLRAGVMTQDQFLASMQGTYMATERNPAYAKISAAESSLRVWETPGSQGYGGVSYYTKGKLIGFLMDVSIRRSTDGGKSLGSAITELYEKCKGEKGYRERDLSNAIGLAGIMDRSQGSAMDEMGLVDYFAYENTVNWQSQVLMAGLVVRDGKLVKNDEMDEKAKVVFESFFGKSK
jgi:predicted metalloprotease with PDZ domain